jgi:hypothetical protein
MAQHAQVASAHAGHPAQHTHALGGLHFDWAMVVLSGWFMTGMYLDGWAHSHGRVDETFFTPWHAVLYSGFLALAAFLGLTLLRNRAQGYGWRQAMPAGYGPSLLGVAIFTLGGLGDMIWHELWGIETGVDALLSPSHLLLASGAALFLAGPFRAAWRRSASGASWPALLPMLLSLTFLLSLWTFLTAFAHPFVQPWAAQGYRFSRSEFSQALGVAGIMLQSALLMGVSILAVRRWTLPFGSLTCIYTLNAASVSILEDHYVFIAVALFAGIVADVLRWRLQPSVQRPTVLRVWAFVVPFALWACYFGALALTGGMWWTIHLWLGATFVSGIVGLLLSYLVVPPTVPAE